MPDNKIQRQDTISYFCLGAISNFETEDNLKSKKKKEYITANLCISNTGVPEIITKGKADCQRTFH